jgi:hypothetical protein
MAMVNWPMAALVMVLASPAAAQPPQLSNAQVQVQAAGGDLARVFEARRASLADPAWIGYAVPMVPGDRFICDWNYGRSTTANTTVKLEGGDTLHVLYRIEQGAVSRIRMFSEGCGIDAGGRPVVWLTDVRAAQSVTLLTALTRDATRGVADDALAALAMHAEPLADTALLGTARAGATPHLRGQALFWVAQRAGDRAIPAIAEAIDRDPDTEVKKKAVFALSQLPANDGVPKLIDVAEHHSNPAVRRQAMFWLGQSRDPRALAFFERILQK